MSEAMSRGPAWSAAMKRYQRRFWPLIIIYAVVVLADAWLIKHATPPGLWRYLAAIVPAVPLLGVIAAIGAYVTEETDEFRRATYVQAMLWALGLVLALTTVWGFLELLTDAPHLQSWWIFPIYSVAQDLAHHLIRRRYR